MTGKRKYPAIAIFDTEYPSSLTILQALGSRGVPVHVYSGMRWPAGRMSPYCVRFAPCPSPVQFNAFQSWLTEKLQTREIQRVVPTTDLLAYHCALLRELFPEEVRNTLHTLDEIEDALIKPRFNRICASIGLPVPETWYPESLAEANSLAPDLPYPVMIKPRSHLAVGMRYRGSICATPGEFLADFKKLEPAPGQEPVLARYPDLCWPMVQRFEANARQKVYSLCGLCDWQSGIVAEAAVCKTDQWPPGVGIGTSFTTLDDVPTFDAGRKIIRRFLKHGFFQIELLVRDDQRLAIDLNPRAYQMMSFDVARGNDLPWLWYRSTLGEKLEIQPRARLGLRWRRNVPFHIGHLVRLLRGPSRRLKWARYRELLSQESISACENSPLLVRLACEGSLLRHPGGLVRPYWNERE